MIVTAEFVFLHYPKTGGLFVAQVLKELHRRTGRSCREIMLPNAKRLRGGGPDPHGTWEQIPAEHRGKPVLAAIRNPFDRYVSIYEFRHWLRPPSWSPEAIRERFPSFPNLGFAEFVDFLNDFDIRSRTHSDRLRADIGAMSYAFIQFFFREPAKTIAALDDAYLDSDRYRDDMAPATFLRQESLREDLCRALAGFGFAAGETAFIRDEARVNATSLRAHGPPWQAYYDPELAARVRRKDRLMFRIFPEYDRPPA